ncbi:hypothetical protein AB0D62_18480 [Streptomyces massasporeus]|uniref:hypothetical protein n=1 Tax=Streptomyces massasporeus TaxID=67324 RepID=UPI0033CEB0A1
MSISHAPPVTEEPDISPVPVPDLDLQPLAPASSRRTRVPRWLRRAAGPVLLLLLWQLLSGTGALPPDVLASPGRIARVGGDMLADGSLPAAMGTSLQRVAGGLMVQARDFLRTDVIVVCLVVYAFLGLLADFVVRSLEKVLLQWRPTFTGR